MGLGVGTRRRDFVAVRGLDVSRDERGVHVAFPETSSSGQAPFPARVTTCAEPWADRLWTLVQALEAPDRYLAAPWTSVQPHPRTVDTTLRNAINSEHAPPPVDFSSESLRNTWLVRHLEAGTPLRVLMEEGALKTLTTIEKLVSYTDSTEPDAAAAWMRRVVRP
jgi:hypothetical protein